MKRRSVVPFVAGTGSACTSILPAALLNLCERWRYPASSDGLGKPTWAGMGAASWAGLCMPGRTVCPGWAPQTGTPDQEGLLSTDGSGVILTTTPLPPKCQPALFSLFLSVISIVVGGVIIIFLPCFPSQH